MTCIVGIAFDGRVMLGADSAAGDWRLNQRIRKDRKVFKNGELIFGFTSSFRMGQLLQYSLVPPPIVEKQEPYEYAVKALVPALRTTLRDGGYTSTVNGREEGGQFLVGFRGHLFYIDADFQVGESTEAFEACGCGDSYAMGAMYEAHKRLVPDPEPSVWTVGTAQMAEIRRDFFKSVLTAGLEAAARFSAGVAPPFNFVEIGGETTHG